ncbi:MAG: hypothetical protein Q9162_002884 [Coniocarpon cinnabarinum]
MPHPLPSPPFVNVPNVFNFRDAGGYAVSTTSSQPTINQSQSTTNQSQSTTNQSQSTTNQSQSTTNPQNTSGVQNGTETAKSVRRAYVYRSAATHDITEEGKRILRDELGIRVIFDLRSKPEIEENVRKGRKIPTIEGVEYMYAPAFAEQPPQNQTPAYDKKQGFTHAYADILAHAQPSVKEILLHILNHPHSPLLIHCAGGKDRTGVVIALILSIAGVDDEIVAEEYALTMVGLRDRKSEMVGRLLELEVLGGNREKAERMVEARKEYLIGTLDMIKEKYGSAEGYVMNECGLGPEELEGVRRNLRSRQAAAL